MKTKNDSMGILKLKLDITPENIQHLQALFVKPENKTSDISTKGALLSSVYKPTVEDLPTVATLKTKFGLLREGDTVVAQSNNKSVYVGTVVRFTDKTIYLKNVVYVFVNEQTNNLGINCCAPYSFSIKELSGVTKNQ